MHKTCFDASGREGFSKIFQQPLSAKAAAENAKRNISLASALAPAATTEARRPCVGVHA